MQRAIPATLADGDVQRRRQARGILQASLIGGQSSKSTDTTLRYARQLFVGDLIDQILAVPPEIIT
jgi:hypothetical protein